MRPSDLEIHETADTALGVAHRSGAIAPIVRRSSTLFSHAYSPFVAPPVTHDPRPPRTAALVSLQTQSLRTDGSIDLTRSSRGPPVG